MYEISNYELSNIKGGGLGMGLMMVAGIIFLIGLVDGYVRPKRCN